MQARLLGALFALATLDAGADATWEPARTEAPERTLERSTRHSPSTRAELLAHICADCSIDEITLRLRELGLNARGTKRACATRLLDADPAFARSHAADAVRFAGHIVEANVVRAARFQTNRASRDVLQCLKERDIGAAIDLALERHAAPGDASIDALFYRDASDRRETARLLRALFTSWPNALGEVPAAARGAYRVAAGMMALHESWCRPEWIDARGPTRFRLTDEQIATTVLRSAQHESRRERWRDAGITHARIVFASAPCAACRRLHDRTYNLRGLPALPPRDCACDGGCSFHLVALRKVRQSAHPRVDLLV